MAPDGSDDTALTLDCYDTALCIIPPTHLWPYIEPLRSAQNQEYREWPPHINLLYPFVSIPTLQKAAELIVSHFPEGGIHKLDFDLFIQIQATSMLLNPERDHAVPPIPYRGLEHSRGLEQLRNFVLDALKLQQTSYDGPSRDADNPTNESVTNNPETSPPLQWTINWLYILIRDEDKARISEGLSSQMKVWGEIDLTTLALTSVQKPSSFYQTEDDHSANILASRLRSRLPYTFSPTEDKWVQQGTESLLWQAETPESLTVASYDVQAEIQNPSAQARYPIIIDNLLDKQALADVLFLQEVTDDFLSQLSKHEGLRSTYPFFSSGPPDQDDTEPLPAHTNVVMLSKWPFSWDSLSLPSGRKGSIVAQFTHIGKKEGGVIFPIILCAIHLSQGLTDDSIREKRQDLASILQHIANKYNPCPLILAGNVNIPTSSYTIETAAREKDISSHSHCVLYELEEWLVSKDLVDAWVSSRIRYGDLPEPDQSQPDINALGGEQSATFDPTVNDLAASTMSDNLEKRPQRYDRILVREAHFEVTGFNLFGRHKGLLQPDNTIDSGDADECSSFGSGHWGVRCTLAFSYGIPGQRIGAALPKMNPIHPLEDTPGLAACLSSQPEFPSEVDIEKRETALSLLREVVLQDEQNRSKGLPAFVLVPTGSYGLGVWTATSDVNCLCIGPISSKVFFTLAIQRLRKAAPRGVKILRRIEDHYGTVLELEVGHIRMDLQYCPSATIAETWPHALTLSSDHRVFDLPLGSRMALKSLRDLCYLQRTIPDIDVFRLAHRFIKCWAKRRGIYADELGYLGGFQISILLSRVYKLISSGHGRSVSAPMLLTSFFAHYAGIDWKAETIFDNFFHKTLGFVRTAFEPMAILGFHGPHLNTTTVATTSTVDIISKEFKRARELTSRLLTTWPEFLGNDTGAAAAEFLRAYRVYINITTRFWNVSLAKGNAYVEWVELVCVALVKDLAKYFPLMQSRIWPARFVHQDASSEDTEYEGHYIVGLELNAWNGEPMTLYEMVHEGMNITALLINLENYIKGDSKHFDANLYWVGARLVSGLEVQQLRLDDRDWSEFTVEAEDDDIGDAEFWASVKAEESKSNEQEPKKGATVSLPLKPAYEGKLRSAGDVINRLRWDQGMDSSDYLIGYEDRFSGVMERPVDSWKSDTTHEEFIPEHRILYFKRKSDGTTVWDRVERRDEIFGSGVTSVEHKG